MTHKQAQAATMIEIPTKKLSRAAAASRKLALARTGGGSHDPGRTVQCPARADQCPRKPTARCPTRADHAEARGDNNKDKTDIYGQSQRTVIDQRNQDAENARTPTHQSSNKVRTMLPGPSLDTMKEKRTEELDESEQAGVGSKEAAWITTARTPTEVSDLTVEQCTHILPSLKKSAENVRNLRQNAQQSQTS